MFPLPFSIGRLGVELRNVLVSLFCCVLFVAHADAEWQAQWIGVAGESEPNTWLAFRKDVELSAAPVSAEARIACDSKYWLWINGELAVFEGQLKRGPTPDSTYFDEVDLTPYLTKGENSIAVLVWHFGKDGFSHNDSGKAGLLFDCHIDGRPLLSDGSWQAMQHPAFGNTGEPHPNFRLPESNIRFDARMDMPDWISLDFDVHAWPKAIEYGLPPAAPWGELHARPIPQWKNSGLLPYESVSVERLEDGSRRYTGALPYNAQVTPWLMVKAPEGKEIGIRTDHYHGGGPPNVRAEYVTREGVQRYESLGWMNGHNVIYTFPEGVEVLELGYRETGYDAELAGSFECDDPALNILWQKALRTLYVNMRDTFFDCPDRERAQWLGDVVIEAQQVYYALDPENGPLLIKKAIREVAGWRREDSVLYGPVPAGWPVTRNRDAASEDAPRGPELPMQVLAFMSEDLLMPYYLATGDRATLAGFYPVMKDYLNLWEIDELGLVKHHAGDWDWPDWGKNHDVRPLENAWYYSALRSAAGIAQLLGETQDLPWYQERMKGIEGAYNSSFWKGDRYQDAELEGGPDDRANAMAVVAGLADESYYPALRTLLESQHHSSPYMEKFVLDALCMMDAPEQAMERMKTRWGQQIESDLTTLWEGWGIGSEGYGGGTTNHAWAGGPLTILSQKIAGISPSKPGWESFTVRPSPGHLRRISTTTPTPLGEIKMLLQRDNAGARIVLDVPFGANADVMLPTEWQPKTSKIRLDGLLVERAEIPRLQSGRHVIEVEM